MLLDQFGGANGELAAAMQYSNLVLLLQRGVEHYEKR
jgi:Mn-containing catalase